MTREEAKEIIKNIDYAYRSFRPHEYEALEMAIKALEQEPKLLQALEMEKGAYNALVKNIHCADAISRQAVLDMMQMRIGGKELYKAVYDMSSVTPAEKTGHWEWVQYDANPEIGNFHCSECRYIPASFNMSAQKLNYCPNCGAKMG